MAVLPGVVQSVVGHTTVASPASVAPSWAASASGSTLVVILGCALSGAPTISTPANWVAGTVVTQGTATDLRVFYFPNATVGTTTVTFNLTNVNGCAWCMYELSGTLLGSPFDTLDVTTNSNAGSTAVSTPNPPIRNNGQIYIAAVVDISTASVTSAMSTGYNAGHTGGWNLGGTDTSTTGATNATIMSHYGAQGAAPLTVQSLYTLGASVAWCAMLLSFYSSQSQRVMLGEGGVINLAVTA